MRKFKKLMLMYEAKEIVTVVYDKGRYQLLGDDGISKAMSKNDVKKVLDSIEIRSLDTKSNDTEDILKEVEKARDSQIDLEVDTKQLNKLGLK